MTEKELYEAYFDLYCNLFKDLCLESYILFYDDGDRHRVFGRFTKEQLEKQLPRWQEAVKANGGKMKW